MLRVLIVDDEYLLCEHIRRSIAWNELGMEVVGMARDGVEGLRCVRELLPDIVLTDINLRAYCAEITQTYVCCW